MRGMGWQAAAGSNAWRSDDELVRLALAGDKTSFGALVQRHWSMVVTVCTRLAKRPDAAADAAQEAAIEALLSLETLRRPGRFGAWWCGIALNLTRRWLRDEARIRGLESAGEPSDEALGPEDVALRAELIEQVREALAALPPGQQEAVRLYYFEERSGLEVARAIGTTAGAVKTRLAKARGRLSHQLADQGEVRMSPRADRVPMVVVDARREAEASHGLRRHVIVLREVNGDRELPIFVGPFEGMAAAVHLEGTQLPRPMTYVLARSLIDAFGAQLTEVCVTHLVDGTFYAEVTVNGPSGVARLDARPSDGINLALLCRANITVDTEVLEQSDSVCRDWPSEAFTDGTTEIAAEARALADLRPAQPEDPTSP
jgi:RNA polymerase sigma factor (sigma-70 family)